MRQPKMIYLSALGAYWKEYGIGKLYYVFVLFVFSDMFCFFVFKSWTQVVNFHFQVILFLSLFAFCYVRNMVHVTECLNGRYMDTL